MSVQLHPIDGEDIIVSRDVCNISNVLKTVLEADDEKELLISINCDRKSLLKAVEYMKKIYTISPTKDLDIIPTISWSTQFSYNLVNYPTEELKSWAEQFISEYENLKDISKLVYAATYLDIPSLLSLCAAYIMNNLRNVDLIAHPEILNWNLDRKTLENFPKSSVSSVWYNNKIFSIEDKMEEKLSNEDIEKIDLMKKILDYKSPNDKCSSSSLIILKNGYFIKVDNVYFQNKNALYLLANSLFVPVNRNLEHNNKNFDLTKITTESKYNVSIMRETYAKDIVITRGFIYPKESKQLPNMIVLDDIQNLLRYGQKIIENSISVCDVSDKLYSQSLRKLIPKPTTRQLILNNFFNASKTFPIDIIPMCFRYDVPCGPEYSCLPKYIQVDQDYEQNLNSPIITYGHMLIYGGEFNDEVITNNSICYFDMVNFSNRNWFLDKRYHGEEGSYTIQKYFQYSHYLGALTTGEINEEKDEKDEDESDGDDNHDRVFLTIWDLDSKTPLEAIYETVVDGKYIGTYEDKVIFSNRDKITMISPNGESKTIEGLGSGKPRIVGKYLITSNAIEDDAFVAVFGVRRPNDLTGIYNMSTGKLFKFEKKMQELIPFEGNNDTFVLVDAIYAEEKSSYQRYLFNNGELKELDAKRQEGKLLGDTNHDNYQIYAVRGEVHLFNLKDFTDTLIWNFGKNEVTVVQFISKTRFAILINSLRLCFIYDINMKSLRKFSITGDLPQDDSLYIHSNLRSQVQIQDLTYNKFIIGVLSNSSFFYKIGDKLYLYSDQMTESVYVKNGEDVTQITEDVNTHQLMVIRDVEQMTHIDVWM